MKIFCGEKDINYSKPERYAFLNWRFDNGIGSNDKNNPLQPINDNFEMGKAYLANAILTLHSLIYTGNSMQLADSLIFPVLFSTWHGVELLLKSCIMAIYLKTGNPEKIKSNHRIDEYLDVLNHELRQLGMVAVTEIELADVMSLVNEFIRVGAHFDFARYSFDIQGDYQFYNAPYEDGKQWQRPSKFINEETVPNTCVDLIHLWKLLNQIAKKFKEFNQYLIITITENIELSAEMYKFYIKESERIEEKFADDYIEKEDSVEQINLYINEILS